ncbi:DUF2931 family protein [Hydromonas duriensis]|uniref:DUF2931 family protein n=1 Tax=Hydromonas duriensis TaxID=1527608 RepID=A0A4R6Y2C1_9BURK|nr:DUF2931 family protein [Hydromonas duriensis]TDR30680.1 hypothetical protein DFR44_11827 [Hydromonas duriensis]
MLKNKTGAFETCISAPRGYEAILVDGWNGYVHADGSGGGFIGSTSFAWDSCDGVAGGHVDGYPERLHLRWLSVAENQFYELDAKLPVDKMKALAEEGYRLRFPITRDGEKLKDRSNFGSIGIMLAPGGGVVLKLISEEARELAYYQAKKIDMPWHVFQNVSEKEADVRQDWIKREIQIATKDPVVLAQINNKQIPFGLWDKVYRQRYPWHIAFAGNYKLEEYFIEYLNTERFMIWSEDLMKDAMLSDRPAPFELDLYFKDASGQRMKGALKLDGPSTAKVFTEFFKYVQNPARLSVQMSDDLKSVSLTLVDGVRSVALPYKAWKVEALEANKY